MPAEWLRQRRFEQGKAHPITLQDKKVARDRMPMSDRIQQSAYLSCCLRGVRITESRSKPRELIISKAGLRELPGTAFELACEFFPGKTQIRNSQTCDSLSLALNCLQPEIKKHHGGAYDRQKKD